MRLVGRRILVARARAGRSELAHELRSLGAEVIEAPQIEVLELSDCEHLDQELGRLDQFDGIVFACRAGIDAVLGRLGQRGRKLGGTEIIAIGKLSRERLTSAGVVSFSFVPGACQEALEAEKIRLQGRRLLLVTSDEGRPSLQSELERLGACVVAVSAYRLQRTYPSGSREPFDLIVVPSSSSARNLFGSDYGGALTAVRSIALGPSAEAAARRLGATRVVRSDTDSILSAVAKALEQLGSPSVQM